MKSCLHLLLIGCILLSPLEAQALSLTQGKWQFVYESTSPFSPQPQKNTDVQCVTATDWDPAQSVAGSGHCKITNVTHDSSAFKGTVSCSRGQGNPPMTGTMEYTSSGTAMTGLTVFKGEGYDMEMRTTGKHLGECE